MRPKSCLQSGRKVDDVLRSPVEGEARHNAETGFSLQKFYLMYDCVSCLVAADIAGDGVLAREAPSVRDFFAGGATVRYRETF